MFPEGGVPPAEAPINNTDPNNCAHIPIQFPHSADIGGSSSGCHRRNGSGQPHVLTPLPSTPRPKHSSAHPQDPPHDGLLIRIRDYLFASKRSNKEAEPRLFPDHLNLPI